MAICITNPIEQDKFNKLVSVVGKKEAARDYFEQNEMVRPPSVVLKKLEERANEVVEEPETPVLMKDFLEAVPEEQVPLSIEDMNGTIDAIVAFKNTQVSNDVIEKFSNKLGIPYNFVSESEAVDKTGINTKGFYYRGEVYLVQDKFTPDTIFHEFMHPVIKSMAVDNPTLFNSLFQDVIDTDFGKTISEQVKEDPYYKNQGDSQSKEETIVRALTYMNENAVENRTLLDKFLYHIRQFLRKIFGRKVNVGKLSLNTKLEDLVDMMNMSEDFILNNDFLKADDIIMLEKELELTQAEMEKKALSDVQKMKNEFRAIVKKQVGLMQADRGIFAELSEDLVNDENTGLLQVMLKNANEFSSEINSSSTLTKPLSDITDNDAAEYFARVENFMNTIAKAKELFLVYDKLIDEMPPLTTIKADQMDQMMAISVLADKWHTYFANYGAAMLTESFKQVFAEQEYKIAKEDMVVRDDDGVIIARYQKGDRYVEEGAMQKTMRQLVDISGTVKDKADKIRYDVVAEIAYRMAKKEHALSDKLYTERLIRLEKKGLWREYDRAYWEYHGITLEEMGEIKILEEKEKTDLENYSIEDEARLARLKNKRQTGHEITREGISDMLQMKGPSASVVNAYMEGFMNSQDKIIGSFFSFMFDTLSEVNANANKDQARFLVGLKDLLKKAKIKDRTIYGVKVTLPVEVSLENLRKVGEGNIGKVLGHRVNIGKSESTSPKDSELGLKPETQTLETVKDWEEWQFLSNFAGQDRALEELRLNIRVANRKFNHYQSDKTKKAYDDAVAIYEQFKIDYMHQDKVPAFYKAESIMKDEIGVKAREVIAQFFQEYNQMVDVVKGAPFDVNSMEAAKKKWREYRYIFSLTDIYGNEKTGDELKIAEKLNEYRAAKQDFYEFKDVPNKFQDSYNTFLDILEEEKIKAGTPEHKARVDEWMEHNTVVEIIQDYYQIRKDAIDERSQLLEPLIKLNASIKDVGPLYKKIYELAKPSRDEQGHYDGNTLTSEVHQQVKEFHEEIEESRYNLYTSLGLTRAELDHYTAMVGFYFLYDKYESKSDEKKVDDYKRRMGEGLKAAPFNLSQEDIDRIEQIDTMLLSLTTNNATRQYINTIEEMVTDDEATADIFDEFLDDVGVERTDEPVLSEKLIDLLLHPKYSKILNRLLESNAKFKKWFQNNHYEADRMVAIEENDEEVKEIHSVYVKTALWGYSAPKSNDFYKSFPLKDKVGNVTGSLKHNGRPRVPNIQYKSRQVKDEFKTKKVERDYVDANGQLVLANISAKDGSWLPMTVAQGAKDSQFITEKYMDMFQNERDVWNLLQHTKENHLDNQRGLEVGQKLGITYPKNRKGDTEFYNRGLFYRSGESNFMMGVLRGRFFESLTRMVVNQADDIEIGMSSRPEGGTNRYETLSRPVSGTYDIHENEVTTNIFGSMHDYAHSVEMFKSLRKINSYAQSVNDMLQKFDTPNDLKWIQRMVKKARTTSDKERVRARSWAINNIIEHWFQGQNLAGRDFKSKKFIAQIQNHLAQKNSEKWFKYNAMASATNASQGKIQMGQKVWDKRLPNAKNLAVGEWKSTKVMALLMRYSYSSRQKPVQLQLLSIMDGIPGNTRQQMGETSARNIQQDIVSGQIGYIDRHNMQNQVEVQALYAMMDKDIYKFQINGKGKKISLDQAVEIVDGRIQTKEGVPQEYSITYDKDDNVILGDMILTIIRRHKGYLQKTIGMAGKTSEAEFLSRSLLGKYMFSLFKFLPPMVMDRFQARSFGRRRRFNWYMQDVEFGRDVGAFSVIRQALNTGFRDISTRELRDAMQVVTHYVMRAALMYLMYHLYFNVGQGPDDEDGTPYGGFSGFDPDESGIIMALKGTTALPRAGGLIDDERSRQAVDWNDYTKLFALRLLMRANRENNTVMLFDPATGGGLFKTAGSIISLKSPMQEGVVTDYRKLGGLFFDQFFGEEEDLEQGATTGPYVWQQEDANKWMKWYGDYRGFSGNMFDPARGISGESLNK